MSHTYTTKPRFSCLNCKRKYCGKENTVCKNCELRLRIKSLDLETERKRILDHFDKHYAAPIATHNGKEPVRYLHKPKYKLFILNRNVGKCGGNTWLYRLDVSLGYPSWDKQLKKDKEKDYVYKTVDVINVHTYGWRYEDLGPYGKHLTGLCVIPGDACVWLEEPYEKMIQEAWEKKNAEK